MYEDPLVRNLIAVCALFWIAAYLLIIKRGFQDKSCGMPMVALCLNASWELIFGFIHPDAPPMDTVNKAWFVIDLVIVAQYLAYGRRRFPPEAPAWMFVPTFAATLLLAFGMVETFTLQFNDVGGPWSAWTMNFVMSGLFVWWVLERSDVHGQSLWIGLGRMLGTAGISVAQLQLTPEDVYLAFLSVGIIALDAAYLILLHRKLRAAGFAPWRRL